VGGAAATQTTTPAADKPAALDYERDVKPLALNVAKDKGREALVTINTTFKVDHAGKLTPAQWPDYVAACNKALA
jgi:hypothetical protein